jgi:hypothetical protein
MFTDFKAQVPCIYTMESSFAGLDRGANKGHHLTSEMLASLGHDLCRCILAYENMHLPKELINDAMFENIVLTPNKRDENNSVNKTFGAAKRGSISSPTRKKEIGKTTGKTVAEAVLEMFRQDAALLDVGAGDSSSGSDDEPSEDNLKSEELVEALPEDKAHEKREQKIKKIEATKKY